MGVGATRSIFFVLSGMLFCTASLAEDQLPHRDRDEAFRSVRSAMQVVAGYQSDVADGLRTNNADAVLAGVDGMLALIPQVKYGPVHRNLDRLKVMGKHADRFRAELQTVATLAKAGNFTGASDRFRTAREQCTLCHAAIRELP